MCRQRFFPYLVYKERYGCPNFQFGGRRANIYNCLSCDQLFYKIQRLRRNISFLEEYYPESDINEEIIELTQLTFAFDGMCSQHSDNDGDRFYYHPKRLRTSNEPNYNIYTGKKSVHTYTPLKFEVQATETFVPDVIPVTQTLTDDQSQEENVKFLDSNVGEKLSFDSIQDDTFLSDYAPSADLGKFLSRPVQVFAFDWAENDTTTVFTFDPWYTYFNDTRIKKKLDNFAFLSCDLHIKVVVNASPFYYGAMMMNYEPLKGLRPSTIATSAGDVINISQRPHIWILPQNNAGAEMVLPFFYHKNYLDITVAARLTEMGTLNFRCFTELQSANGAGGTGVDVTVYAWATNVKLTGPTVRLAVQARDEYVISKPATAIAEAAGLLTKIPFIGPFATATQIGAQAVSKVASLFGFTNVPVVSDVQPMKNLVFHSLASTEISEPVEKLTFDPKSELTLDSRTVGLSGVDELNLSSFIQRESYLTQFQWTSAENGGDIQFNTEVHPLMHKRDAAINGVLFSFTPMALTQYLFKNWRGSSIYRFKIIKSKFHKGRLRVTWDPRGDIIADSISTTVAFTQIIDIGETDEFEIVVPYLQSTAWSKTFNDSQAARWQITGFANLYSEGRSNGTLTVRVLNALSGPLSVTNIYVQVFVRAGPDMEFANPVNPPRFSTFAPQAREEFVSDAVAMNTSEASISKEPKRYLINYGESILSFRQLFRRSCLNLTNPMIKSVTVGTNVNTMVQTMLPLTYGYDPAGFHVADSLITPGTPKTFNFVPPSAFTWIAPCFIGWRGSMIWHFNADSGIVTKPFNTLRVCRRSGTFTTLQRNGVFVVDNTSDSYNGRSTLLLGATAGEDGTTSQFSGVAQTNQWTQSGLSVLVPFYNRFRMAFYMPTYANQGNAADDTDTDNIVITAKRTSVDTTVDRYASMERYFSIGPDFNLFFFQNVPTMYLYTAVPAAV